MNVELLKQSVEYGIIGILLIMGFLVVWIWIERLLFFKSLNVKEYTKKELLEIDLTSNTSIVYTCGSNAPYIGLLGTVIGIIATFYTMGQTGNIDVKTIMTSLALALKATAMGLFVAIPAVFIHNYISRRIEVILTLWDASHK